MGFDSGYHFYFAMAMVIGNPTIIGKFKVTVNIILLVKS